MIEFVDSQIVTMFSEMFLVPPENIFYGSYTSALNAFLRENRWEKLPGVLEVPFLAFSRLIMFDEERRDSQYFEYKELNESVGKRVRMQYVRAEYNIETLLNSVHAQNEQIKKFTFKSASNPVFIAKYGDSTVKMPLFFNSDPTDTSELDYEEDIGRNIRSTYSVTIRVPLLEVSYINGDIKKVLSNVKDYYVERL